MFHVDTEVDQNLYDSFREVLANLVLYWNKPQKSFLDIAPFLVWVPAVFESDMCALETKFPLFHLFLWPRRGKLWRP